MSVAADDDANNGLKTLNNEYLELSKQEDLLEETLQRLEKEEITLKQALKEANETGAQRLQQQRRDQEATALERLEQALMESSEDDEEDNHHNDNHSLFSMDAATKSSKMSE